MNFSHLTKQLQLQAEKASAVARNFKGFDEMAAQDAYIHSDSLNVKNKMHDQVKQQKPILQSVSPWTELTTHTTSRRAASLQSSCDGRPAEVTPQSVSYRDNQHGGTTNNRRASYTVSQPADIEHSLSSDDESDEDDPILQQVMTKQRNSAKRTTQSHRFMDELDDRIAKENIALALPVVVRDPVETQSQLTSWLSDMLDRKQASNSKRHSEMAPLSRKKLSQSANGRVDAINSLGGDYNVLVSSSILDRKSVV